MNTTISRQIRFVNFITDLLIFAIISSAILVTLKSNFSSLSTDNKYIDRIISLLLYSAYYLVCEGIFRTTPGKFLTKTKVVTNDGEAASFQLILIRSITRIIPFEPLSIFFSDNKNCWHDTISKTKLIRVNH